MSEPALPIENRLLAALPKDAYQRLLPHLEPVTLKPQQVLYETGDPLNYVYFPHKSLLSLVSRLKNGDVIEARVVGNEGMVSSSAFIGGHTMPYQVIVQSADGAMKMPAAALKEEFQRGGPLQTLLLRYAEALHLQLLQTATCNRVHSLDERLAYWLLMTHDCIQSDQLALTQEFMATLLGVERSGVTLAAITLRETELIKYGRGEIKILDRAGLERVSCECYRRVKVLFDELLKP